MLLYTMLLVDINYTSIHNFYRDRLSEAFVWGGQQCRLADLGTHHSPYHLLNAAINVEHALDDYRNGRRSSFFVFSKAYCGSFRTGYCRTTAWPREGEKLDIGTAMAISGAAVAPNMGKLTTPALTFILTMLNLRLNLLAAQPEQGCGWRIFQRSRCVSRVLRLKQGGAEIPAEKKWSAS